jgi:hypothetical protein
MVSSAPEASVKLVCWYAGSEYGMGAGTWSASGLQGEERGQVEPLQRRDSWATRSRGRTAARRISRVDTVSKFRRADGRGGEGRGGEGRAGREVMHPRDGDGYWESGTHHITSHKSTLTLTDSIL